MTRRDLYLCTGLVFLMLCLVACVNAAPSPGSGSEAAPPDEKLLEALSDGKGQTPLEIAGSDSEIGQILLTAGASEQRH